MHVPALVRVQYVQNRESTTACYREVCQVKMFQGYNMSRTEKVPLLVTGKYAKSRCFKGTICPEQREYHCLLQGSMPSQDVSRVQYVQNRESTTACYREVCQVKIFQGYNMSQNRESTTACYREVCQVKMFQGYNMSQNRESTTACYREVCQVKMFQGYNMSRTERVPLLVTGKYAKSRCFKGTICPEQREYHCLLQGSMPSQDVSRVQYVQNRESTTACYREVCHQDVSRVQYVPEQSEYHCLLQGSMPSQDVLRVQYVPEQREYHCLLQASMPSQDVSRVQYVPEQREYHCLLQASMPSQDASRVQ